MSKKETAVCETAYFTQAISKKDVDMDKVPRAGSMRVVQVFFCADMRLGHLGLTLQAKAHGIDVTSLVPGQFVVFINSHEDKVKVFASNNVVAYLQLPGGRKVDARVIQEIPRAFNSGAGLNYDTMLKKVVEDHFAKRTTRKGILHATDIESKEHGASKTA